jgi:hypothetical protein
MSIDNSSHLFGKKVTYYFIFLLLFADLSYSFIQHLCMPLDGDMAECILPSKELKKIFEDPLGISIITENAIYPNPNRFFGQWTYSKYFKHLPATLQNFVSPIESVYLSSAISKISIQIGLLILLAFYITGTRKIFNSSFLLAVIIIVPLFQTNGYRSYMGIIDPSITYTFFYALPCTLLVLFYLPFFNVSFHQTNFISNKLGLILLFAFIIFLTLNGPLTPGIVLVISLLYFYYQIKSNYCKLVDAPFILRITKSLKKIPRAHFIYFTTISILSLYSLYIGSHNYNSIYESDNISIYERYLRLPMGLYYLLTQKIGFPVLLIMIGINAYLINRKLRNEEGIKILNLLKWIGIFSLLYILLLPLGGYRNCRPNIIRYDTIMPITIALILIYGMSTYFLIKNSSPYFFKRYLPIIIVFSMIFTFADKPEFAKNNCEKKGLEAISQSNNDTVLVECDCSIMAWEKIGNPSKSELNAQLLGYWGITKKKKLYYQKIN